MEKTERRYWQSGYRFDRLWSGKRFFHVYFRIGMIGVAICQPFRGNDVITFYKLT